VDALGLKPIFEVPIGWLKRSGGWRAGEIQSKSAGFVSKSVGGKPSSVGLRRFQIGQIRPNKHHKNLSHLAQAQGVGDGGGKKNREKYVSGNYYEQFVHFSGKNHVKFAHFVNFSYILFGQKCLASLKLTELLRL